MNDIEKLLADPVVTLILIILIGAIIGWLYEEWTHSPHGYITSALVGVAGSYTGYALARLANITSNAALIRLLAAAAEEDRQVVRGPLQSIWRVRRRYRALPARASGDALHL